MPKPTSDEKLKWEEHLSSLQDFKRAAYYETFMSWVDAMTKEAFDKLMTSDNPTIMAKYTGVVGALKTVRQRIDFEITAANSFLNKDID